MVKAVKTLIVDADGMHLLLYRAQHPRYGNDPDLPGGTVEKGEQHIEALIREVEEEVGIEIYEADTENLYRGRDFSTNYNEYTLYKTVVSGHPTVTLSWEHSTYEWLTRDDFLKKIEHANDSYMRMVYEKISQIPL